MNLFAFALTVNLNGPFLIGLVCALVVTGIIALVRSGAGDSPGRYGSGLVSGILFFVTELVLIPVFIGGLIAAGALGGDAWSMFFGWALVRVPACIINFMRLK